MLRRLKIGTRLGIAFGAILAVMMVVTVVATALGKQSRHELAAVHAAAAAKGELAAEMRFLVLDHAGSLRSLALQNTVKGQQEADERTRKLARSYDAARERMSAQQIVAEERQILEGLHKLDGQVEQAFQKLLAHSQAFRTDEAAALVVEEVEPLVQKTLQEIARLIELQKQADRDATAAAMLTGDRLAIAIYVVAVLALVLTVLVAWTVTRSITAPLAEAVQVAQKVAAGDLTSNVDASGRDEAAELLGALRDMNGGLGQMVTQIRTGAESIAVGAGQVAAGNQQLSSRTEEHASSLEETASTLEEFTTTVRQNAEHAKQASALAGTASATAAKGGEVVGRVVTTMQDVTVSSKKISDIIGVIDGISFQTNILALNAAVEAARAGEQGRGFAVVASEVRSLAQRSAASAKEIRGLIETSVSKVENGAKLVEQAGRTMDELVVAVRKVAEIMTEIAAASHEQSSGIDQINKAITQMDNVVQMNASLVEQATAAATSMAGQAQGLARAVAQFRLESALPAVDFNAMEPAAPAPRRAAAPEKRAAIAPAGPVSTLPAAPAGRREPALAAAAADEDWKEF